MIELPDEPALVTYFTAGHPEPDDVPDIIDAFERGGADVVEVGLPFSEPIADGPTIQNAITRSLDNGMTPDLYFDLLADTDADVPLVCMTYYNLLLKRGVETFVEDASEVGVEGIIVPDLPVEEADELHRACRRNDVDLVFIVAPTTTDERLERILDRVSGFLYVQARLGTTGARDDVSRETYEVLEGLDDVPVPRIVGFGVSREAQAREIVEGGADGVVAGSVFVDGLDRGRGTDYVEEKTRELKRGALDGV